MQAIIDAIMGPGTLGGRALSLSGAFSVDGGTFNRRDVHAAEIPAANAITNAASLAKVYAATLGPVDGVQLLEDGVRDRARTEDHARTAKPTCACRPRRRSGSGSWSTARSRCTAVPGSYGHPGAGGSVAFADPDRDLAFAYVMNTMATNLAGDTRAQQLIDAAVAATR